MVHELKNHTLLSPTSFCTVRNQDDYYLFYNCRTDELHLLSSTGLYVYQLCDGATTLGDIEERMSKMLQVDREILRPRLHNFVEQLLSRRILEGENHD